MHGIIPIEDTPKHEGLTPRDLAGIDFDEDTARLWAQNAPDSALEDAGLLAVGHNRYGVAEFLLHTVGDRLGSAVAAVLDSGQGLSALEPHVARSVDTRTLMAYTSLRFALHDARRDPSTDLERL